MIKWSPHQTKYNKRELLIRAGEQEQEVLNADWRAKETDLKKVGMN